MQALCARRQAPQLERRAEEGWFMGGDCSAATHQTR
jgi:hypothetical protein